jgi:hypothetical protein
VHAQREFKFHHVTSICTEFTLGKEEKGRAMEEDTAKATPMMVTRGMRRSTPTAMYVMQDKIDTT